LRSSAKGEQVFRVRPVAGWGRLSIFLNLLIPKLPAPPNEDLARGILESIDMDSYRAEKRAAVAIPLPDQDA
jgi:type I restriction enzyme R subunit